jgi:hypothetical protein
MDSIPPRWLEPPHLESVIERLRGLPVLEAKNDTFRAAVALSEKDGTARWIARNFMAAGNYLVHLEIAWGGVDPELASNYKEAVLHLGSRSVWRLALTKFTYLIGTDAQLEELFTELVRLLGMKHHSVAVIDLFKGQGLLWHGEEGVTVEIEPAKPG